MSSMDTSGGPAELWTPGQQTSRAKDRSRVVEPWTPGWQTSRDMDCTLVDQCTHRTQIK